MTQIILSGLTIPEFQRILSDEIKQQLLLIYQKGKEEKRLEFITAKDACAILKITKPTLSRWVAEKRLKRYRVGRCQRFLLSEVEEAVKAGLATKYGRRTDHV